MTDRAQSNRTFESNGNGYRRIAVPVLLTHGIL